MKKENKSRSAPDKMLQTPSEANRDKHVNFVAQERGDIDPSVEPDNNKLLKSRKRKNRKEEDR